MVFSTKWNKQHVWAVCLPTHTKAPYASKLASVGQLWSLVWANCVTQSWPPLLTLALRLFLAVTEMKSCSWITKWLLFRALTVYVPFLTLWLLCVQSLTETVKLTTGVFQNNPNKQQSKQKKTPLTKPNQTTTKTDKNTQETCMQEIKISQQKSKFISTFISLLSALGSQLSTCCKFQSSFKQRPCFFLQLPSPHTLSPQTCSLRWPF